MGVMVVLGACGGVGGRAPQTAAAPVPIVEPVVAPEPEPEPRLEPVEPPPAVQQVAPEPAPVEPPPPAEPVQPPWSDADEPRILAIQPLVAAAAEDHGVDPHLINGVIWVESKFHRKAHNRSGARGLMQLMPKTAKAIGRKLSRPAKVYDAEFNVQAGTWYLAGLLAKFDGDERLALASYVRGPAKIRAWVEAGEPIPDSIQRFVDKVQRMRRIFEAKGWPPPAPQAPAPASGDPSS